MSDIIRISEQGKRQLIALKRSTKIDQWNILCRWALCSSLQDQTVIREMDLGPMSNVEMTWEILCGPFQQCVNALLQYRFQQTPQEIDTFADVPTLCAAHIHRGVVILSHKKPDTNQLIRNVAMIPTKNHVNRRSKNASQ
mgnify:CR=1 FL=1